MARGVLFDLDNTLYDRDIAIRSWAEGFVAERLPNDGAVRDSAIEALVTLDESGYRPREQLFGRVVELWPFIEAPVDCLAEARLSSVSRSSGSFGCAASAGPLCRTRSQGRYRRRPKTGMRTARLHRSRLWPPDPAEDAVDFVIGSLAEVVPIVLEL